MKVLLYGDLQINVQRSDHLNYLTRTLGYLCELIDHLEPDVVVHLGDHTDTFGIVDIRSLGFAYDWLHTIGARLKRTQHHLVIMGNHDISDDDGKYSTTSLFRDIRQVFPITSPTFLHSHGILALPYAKDLTATRTALADAVSHNPVCCVGHVDWIGIKLSPKIVTKKGLTIEEYQQFLGTTPFFNGHYHNPVSLPPLYVVGAPIYQDFSDDPTIPRGFMFFDTESDQPIKFYENPNTYLLRTVEVLEKKDLAQIEALRPEADRIRLRVYTTTKLLKSVRPATEGFLWSAVHITDAQKARVDHAVKVTATTPPGEIIDKTVAAAPAEYKQPLLRAIGEEALL